MRAPPAISALIIGAVNVAVGTAAYAVALPSPSDSPNNETFSDMVPRAKCPDGQDYSSFDEDFRSIGPNLWTIDSGASGIKASSDGLILTLSKEMGGSGGIVLASRASWGPPMTMSVQIATGGESGAVYPFILKGAGTSGEEIDLEITEDDFQLPVWKDGSNRLTKNGKEAGSGAKDLKQTLYNGVREESIYKYTYSGYNPRKWTTYKLHWTSKSITWSIDGKKRVVFAKRSDKFPTGPLPIRFGPWAAQPGSTWAGKAPADWQDQPVMKIRNLKVKGCKTR